MSIMKKIFFLAPLFLLSLFNLPFQISKKESENFKENERFKEIDLIKSDSKTDKQPFKLDHTLSLMSWNVCFLPWMLPKYFGGLPPATARVDAVADFIIEANADVVCLQEMHDTKATRLLIERLKKVYGYFIVDKRDSLRMTLNSGLFVASRYPIEPVDFTTFNYKNMPWGIDKGYLIFKIKNAKGNAEAVVATTHLHPGSKKDEKNLRALELQEITTKLMKQIEENSKQVAYLCGDLNIDRETNLPVGKFIKAHYYDSFASLDLNRSPPCTSTELFNELRKNSLLTKKIQKNPFLADRFCQESIDYILLLEGGAAKKVLISPELLDTFGTGDPQKALSDHRAVVLRTLFLKSI